MRTVRVKVFGRVQGVGFRYYAVHTARSLGITGYVRNETDGSVEAIATGDFSAVDTFIRKIVRGPVYANVTGSVVEEIPLQHFGDFEARY